MKLLTLAVAGFILFVPNQIHFPVSLGVRGLNLFNLMFIGAFALLAMRSAGAQAGTTTSAPRPPLTGILLLFYLVLGISLVIGLIGGSNDPIEDITIYKTVVAYSLLYFLAYYGIDDRRTIRVLVGLMVVVFAIAALEAIKEGLTYGFGNYNEERRAAGPFGHGSGNSNFAGVFYGIFGSFSLALAVLGRDLKWIYRVVALGCYGLGCIAIFATYSRQSLLIIGVGTLLVALRRNPLLAGIALMGMLSYPLWAPEGIVERVEMTHQESSSETRNLEYSAASRYELWGGAWEIMKDNPAGVGFNQFQDEIEPFLPSWVTARDAQNQYLLIGAEAGFLGLLVYLALILALFRIGRRLARLDDPPEARAFGDAMSIAVVAVIMGNIYSSTFFSGEVMGNFWILAGLMSRYRVLAESEEPLVSNARDANPLENVRQVYARWNRTKGEVSRET